MTMKPPPLGAVSVLSVGEGDLTLNFDKSKPAERARAQRIVSDMLARGYAILIQVGEQNGEPIYQRAKAFDPETCEYLIVGLADDEAVALGGTETEGAPSATAEAEPAPTQKRRGRPPKMHRVPAERTRTVAVARTAGG